MVRFESSYTDVLQVIVDLMKDFHDTAMCGDSYKHDGDDVENGPMSSACCVEQLVAV